MPCLLESGAILLWDDKRQGTQQKITEYLDNPKQDEFFMFDEPEEKMNTHRKSNEKKNGRKTGEIA